jgi:outer membrane protein assembly factor BamB/PKD repeat protein
VNNRVKPVDPAGKIYRESRETIGNSLSVFRMTGLSVLLILICTCLALPVTAMDQDVPSIANQDTNIIWSAPLPDDPTSPPVVVGETVYVTYGDTSFQRPTVNGLDAFFAGNGTRKWHYSIREDPNAYFTTPPTIADHVAYIGGWDGSVHAVNTETGKRIWRYRTGAADHTTHYTIQSAPVVYENLVIFGSDDGYVYAVTAREGQVQWKTDLTHDVNVSVRGSPLIIGHMLYIGGDDQVLHELNATTGIEAWQFKAKDRVRGNMVALWGSIVCFTAGDTLYAINTFTHQPEWVFQKGGQILSAPVRDYRGIAVTSSDGYLRDIDSRTGKEKYSMAIARLSVQQPTKIGDFLLVSSGCDGDEKGAIYFVGCPYLYGQFVAPGSFKYPAAAKDGIAYAVSSSPFKDNTYRDYTYLYAYGVIPTFTAQPRTGIVPFTVQFTNEFEGETVTDQLWEFGDGTISHEKNPSHTYTDPRTYRVNLTINPFPYNTIYTSTRRDYITAMSWKEVLGGSDDDFGKISIQTKDGGVLVVGETRSLDGDIHGNLYPDGQQIVVAKYRDGHRERLRLFGGSDEQEANYVLELDDGYLVIGSTRSNDGDVSGNHGGSSGTSDVWVLKLDQYGHLIWQKCYGGTNDETGMAAAVEKDQRGNDAYYVIAGSTRSNDGDVSGNHGGSDGTADAWVFKIDPDGNLISQQCYGGTGDDKANYIEESNDGSSWIIAGSTSSTDGDLKGKRVRTDEDVWIFSIPGAGQAPAVDPGFNRIFGGSHHDEAMSIQRAPLSPNGKTNGYVTAGFTESDDGDVSRHYGLAGSRDIWILKIADDGTLEWEKNFGGSKDDVAAAIRIWDSTKFYVLGYTASNDYDAVNLNHGGNSGTTDIFLLKLDYSGNLLSSHCYGGSLNDFGVRFGDRPTVDGPSYIIGDTNSDDGDVAGLNHGASDIVVFQLSNGPAE